MIVIHGTHYQRVFRKNTTRTNDFNQGEYRVIYHIKNCSTILHKWTVFWVGRGVKEKLYAREYRLSHWDAKSFFFFRISKVSLLLCSIKCKRYFKVASSQICFESDSKKQSQTINFILLYDVDNNLCLSVIISCANQDKYIFFYYINLFFSQI